MAAITINGVVYNVPDHVLEPQNEIKIKEDKVFINGWELNQQTGEFSKPMPFWFLVFISFLAAMGYDMLINLFW